MYILDNYAYVGGQSVGRTTPENIGVRILDLSDPTNPRLVGRIPLRSRGFFKNYTVGDAVATHISTGAFKGDVAIVLNGVPDSFAPDSYPQPFGIWDVTDPSNSTFLSVLNLGNSPHGLELGSLDSKPYDSKAVAGNYFYALYDNSHRTVDFEREGWEDHLAVVDISDPRNPVVVGDWQDDRAVWLSGVSLNESATRAYVTGFSGTQPNWIGDGYLYVLDIQNPSQPTELGRYVFPTDYVDVSIARPTGDDNLVALADHAWYTPCGILHILDTSNPDSIHEISTFALPQSSLRVCESKPYYIATDVAIRGNLVYSTWLGGGVRAIDISDPANPVQAGWFLSPQSGYRSLSDIALLGTDLVVATTVWWSGLYILSSGTLTNSDEEITIPRNFSLSQNYPNPFNPVTTLRYDLPERVDVALTIYDILGGEVRTLVREVEEPGYKSVIWDGTNDAGRAVSAGVYLYRIQTSDFTQTRKMVLLK
ncbi:MAG: FlgD immunoglobulin-like domain containing protein [Candidatus Binatia bacterium]